MEQRILLTALPIVNSGFDTVFKPGSTAITATLSPGTRTTGFGGGVAVVDAGGAPAQATYSDGTSGASVDVPGWTVFAGSPAGVENAPGVFPGKTDNFAYVKPNANSLAFINQTLAGVSLLPNTTYILTVVVGAQGQSTPDASAVAVDLFAGNTQLTPTDGSSPNPSPGTLPTASRVFVTGASPAAGNLTISLGLDAPTTASEFDFDNVSLTTTPGSHPTPTPTPTAAITATFSAPSITTLGQSIETITAVYSDPAGVDLSSVNAGNLQVSAPDGTALGVASFSATPASGIVPVATVTYTINAPFGTWTSADNGTYTVTLPAGELSDSDTNTNAVAGITFTIAAPGGPTASTTDTTFDGGGAERLLFSGESVAVQDDGKFLVAGQQPGAVSGSTQAVLERVNVNGALDTTFGAGGAVTDNLDNNETFNSVAIQADGKIIAAGSSGGMLLLARYNADGSPDPSFGSAGRMVAPVAGTTDAAAYGIALGTTDNSIVVAGSAGGQFLLDRFTANGSPDPAFNGGLPSLFGSASAGNVFGRVAIQSDGGIVAAGASSGSVVVARVTAAGAVDNTFGTSGIAAVSQLAAPDLAPGQPDHTEGLALDPAGNILVANHTAAGHFGLVRLTPAGAIDTTFGTAGLATADFGGNDDADFVGVTSTSQILVAGTSLTSASPIPRIAVAAFTLNGSIDTTFATNGQEVFDSGVPASTVTASTARPRRPSSPGIQPNADGSGSIVQQVIASLQPNGKAVVGASQQGGAAMQTSGPKTALRRLNVVATPTPTPSPTPLPTGTLDALLSARLPMAVVGGAKAKTTAVVTVRNPTGQLVSGRVPITLYVNEANSLTGATLLATTDPVLKLKPHQSKAVKLTIAKFPKVPDGSYFLLAGVTAPDASVTGVAGPALRIAAPFVTIHESNVRPLPASAAPGKPVSLMLTLQNAGNIIAAGAPKLTILGSVDPSASGQALAAVPLHLKLNPNAVKSYRVKFRVPAGLAANRYYLTASLNLAALGDTNPADGLATSITQLTVT
jgi:uncharacterized delta-60 repeat protein